MTRCSAIIKSGRQCSRHTTPSSVFCKQHQRIAEFEAGSAREKTWLKNTMSNASTLISNFFGHFALLGWVLAATLLVVNLGSCLKPQARLWESKPPFLSDSAIDREISRLSLNLWNLLQRAWATGGEPTEDYVLRYISSYLTAYESDRQVLENRYNADSILTSQPVPSPLFSLDRNTLRLRSKIFNDPGQITYLYLFLPGGRTMEMRMRGRLVSVTKGLLPGGTRNGSALPDEKGLYGNDGQAWSGFTASGGLIEVGSRIPYLLSENQLNFGREELPGRVEELIDYAREEQLLQRLFETGAEEYPYPGSVETSDEEDVRDHLHSTTQEN